MSPERQNHHWLRTTAIDRFDSETFYKRHPTICSLHVFQYYFSEVHSHGGLSQYILFHCWVIFRYMNRQWYWCVLFLMNSLSFPVGAVMNKTMEVLLVFWCTWTLVSVGHTCGSGRAGSEGRRTCSISRHCHTVFQSSCTIFHSHQPAGRMPVMGLWSGF